MMTKTDENLNELLSKFFDEAEVAQVERDIRVGDDLVGSFDGPVLEAGVVEGIKADIANQLVRRRRNRRVYATALRVTAVAIVVLAVFARVWFFGIEESARDEFQIVSKAIWGDEEGQTLDDGDIQLTILANEIDDLENELLEVRLGEYKENIFEAPEFGTEMIDVDDINSDFWKG